MVSAWRAFDGQRKQHGFWKALIKTKDPSTIIVLLGDIGDLLGLMIAFLGIFIGRMTNNPKLDGYASILIGTSLLVISGFLIRESKSLLLGESIGRGTKRAVVKITEQDETVTRVTKVASIYRSPEDAMVCSAQNLNQR
jgi:divalent metal cation (Fe/Co/Zn/Cd) transporter